MHRWRRRVVVEGESGTALAEDMAQVEAAVLGMVAEEDNQLLGMVVAPGTAADEQWGTVAELGMVAVPGRPDILADQRQDMVAELGTAVAPGTPDILVVALVQELVQALA